MQKIKVGINGYGRIGQAVARIALDRPDVELVAINTRRGSNKVIAYRMQYDSIYRKYGKKVEANDEGIIVDGNTIYTILSNKPEDIPWGKYGVQVVIDATGAFLKNEDLSKHIRDSVKRVIVTAPAKDETPTIVLGVNESDELLQAPVLSNASCTTNCAAPLFKVLNDSFGIKVGQMTTIHAYTMSQSMLDEANVEVEHSRSAVMNIIPSSSGAAKAVVQVIPELRGKIDVFAVRVPVPVGSASDLSVILNRDVTVEEVNDAFKRASVGTMFGVLEYLNDFVVSSDIIGNTHSSCFDPRYTKVTGGNMVKVFGWYDNEWGYSCRVVDLAVKIGKHL